MSISSRMLRLLFGRGDKRRDRGLETPQSIERFDNISYGKHGKWNLLDVYRPKNEKGLLPVIVNVHGGGWVYGDKDVYQYYCMSLAEHGFAVVNFSYRLAPEYKFPASVEDTYTVMKWIQQNSERYGMDVENIFMVGDSAGANLAALYTERCLMKEHSVPRQFVPKAVALNCGVYDIQSAVFENLIGSRSLMKDLLGKEMNEKLPILDVYRYIDSGFPPVYLMSAEGDFLKEQIPVMEKSLKENKVPYKMKIYGSKESPLSHVFHCDTRNKEAQVCNQEECDFFKSFLTDRR